MARSVSDELQFGLEVRKKPMMVQFDPISALVGGALIGLASVLLMVLTGRIAGISGILTGCFALVGGDKVWRVAFISGLILAPAASSLIGYPLQTPLMPTNWAIIVVAGVLVGLGARIGDGCTPVMASAASLVFRFVQSWRPLLFMATAVAVVAIVRHGLES